MDNNEIKITVKWSGKEYEIVDIQSNDSVLSLKDKIYLKTGVRPQRQKLLNLKIKGMKLLLYSINCDCNFSVVNHKVNFPRIIIIDNYLAPKFK